MYKYHRTARLSHISYCYNSDASPILAEKPGCRFMGQMLQGFDIAIGAEQGYRQAAVVFWGSVLIKPYCFIDSEALTHASGCRFFYF